jgi:hypothetical protein
MPDGSCIGSSLLQPICQGLGGIGSSIFSSGASAALDALSSWVASGSTWLLGQIGSAFDATTKVSLDAPWFLTRYRSMEGLLAVAALPLLIAASIQALVQQKASVLLRAALVQLPLAMLLAGAAVELTGMALSTTDELAAAVSSATPGALSSLTGSLATALVGATAASGSAMPSFVAMLCAALVAAASLVLWIELALRAAAIYVVVLFLPLALACSVWPALSSWCRRLVETLVALILSKLVVVVVLDAAVGALGTQQGRGFATVISGIALLALATLAPFTLLRLLPIFEASAALQLEGLRQRGTASVTSGMPRQAAMAALDGARGAAPLVAPAAIGVLSAAAGTATAQLDSVGHRSEESPMASSALQGDGAARTADGDLPVLRDEQPAAAASTVASARPEPPRSPPPLSSLVVGRDQWGPVIRMREAPRDER